MKKIKHSKFKNTAMLFELLTRQITSDIISANESVAIQILKKYFNKNTELIKEYRLYKTLCDERLKSDTKANMLIEAVLKARRGLNRRKLQTEKYELIKSIKENYNYYSNNPYFMEISENGKTYNTWLEMNNVLKLNLRSKLGVSDDHPTSESHKLISDKLYQKLTANGL